MSSNVFSCLEWAGLAFWYDVRLAGWWTSVRFRFSCPLPSKVVHCLVTLSLTINGTLKRCHPVHLNALWWGCNIRYLHSLPLPPPPGISVLASTPSETNENNEHSQTTVSQKGFSSRWPYLTDYVWMLTLICRVYLVDRLGSKWSDDKEKVVLQNETRS